MMMGRKNELMERFITECNTVVDLKRKCKKYGDSYYEDKEGWKLIVGLSYDLMRLGNEI